MTKSFGNIIIMPFTLFHSKIIMCANKKVQVLHIFVLSCSFIIRFISFEVILLEQVNTFEECQKINYI